MKITVLSAKKIFALIASLTALALAVFCVSESGAYAVFFGNGYKKLPIYSVRTEQKKVAISFDCAWGADYTQTLLNVMRAENVKCTFFTVRFWAEKYADYVKKISDEGHEIGSHSSTHPHMAGLSAAAIEKEIKDSAAAVEKITGKKVELFRPPFGEYNDLVIETCEKLGLFPIQWSVDSLDWKNLSAKEIESRVVNGVKNGSIVLFHNQGLHTAEALPNVIKSLKNKGYEFVPIGELIYRTDYKIAPDGAQIKNV